MYKKRAGTSGIQGQLYETKLISLIYFRMKHDDDVSQFSLATNRDDVGAFDDICFKAKVKDFPKPVTVFIQARHRENDKLLTFNSKIELPKYFYSYLDVRRAFDPYSKDVIFGGKFDETECFFVMYTSAAKADPNNKIYDGSFAEFLNKLIGTGGSCTQPAYSDEDLDFLCKIVMKEQITSLAEHLAKFICDESDSEMSMNNDLILRYHVILALNVLHVSEIQPEGHRIASFRQNFFTTEEEFLLLMKNILCLEVLKKRKSEDIDLQSLMLQFLSNPSEITTLSKLIGNVLMYKNHRLQFICKPITDDLKQQFNKANVPESIIYEAAELAAKEHLLSLKFKVPASFGNKDLAIRGKPDKIEKRLNYLTSKIIEIFEQPKPKYIVTIDESLGDGFLQLNGGLASAVGNILVFDETSKLLKFTDNAGSLGNLAKTCYEILNSKIKNLHEYKLDVKVKKFPKLSFERGEYDMNLVRDFYDKLLFYTNQADHKGVEDILNQEIEDHPCNDANNYRVRSEFIFLKYHDEIQKLWMNPNFGSYLTKKSKIYENAVINAMNEPLLNSLNTMYKINNKDYPFNENAIKRLELHGQILGTVIATGSCRLTVPKVEQYLGNKDRVVLDLEYIFKLTLESHNTLCEALKNTTKKKILIIVCDNFQDTGDSHKKLENIAKAVDGKQIIVITNKISVDIIIGCFSQARLIDDVSVFTDMGVKFQKELLTTSKLKFQDEILSLDTIVDDEIAKLIDEDVLNQIINNEAIVIGKSVIYYDYNKIKPYYIDRRVSRKKNQEHDNVIKYHVLETLYDLEDKVVLLRGLPEWGKSTLLTHLSIKTKKLGPKTWIVRINYLEHERIFKKWQDDATAINTLESLKFICKAALGEEPNDSNNGVEDLIELEESSDGLVSLKKCSGGFSTVFQVKVFLHFYNQGKLIFIFDGFDNIVPRYEIEALSLVTAIARRTRQHKIWIASSFFYDSESEYILMDMFGLPYFLEPFSRQEKDTYCNKLWKTMIQFKELDSNQIQNVYDFMNFALKILPLLHIDFHVSNQFFKYYYWQFIKFLEMEAVAFGFDFQRDEINHLILSLESEFSGCPDDLFQAPPLHLNRLAERFPNRILDVTQIFFHNRGILRELFD